MRQSSASGIRGMSRTPGAAGVLRSNANLTAARPVLPRRARSPVEYASAPSASLHGVQRASECSLRHDRRRLSAEQERDDLSYPRVTSSVGGTSDVQDEVLDLVVVGS